MALTNRADRVEFEGRAKDRLGIGIWSLHEVTALHDSGDRTVVTVVAATVSVCRLRLEPGNGVWSLHEVTVVAATV
jgi:hypothetical protein